MKSLFLSFFVFLSTILFATILFLNQEKLSNSLYGDEIPVCKFEDKDHNGVIIGIKNSEVIFEQCQRKDDFINN